MSYGRGRLLLSGHWSDSAMGNLSCGNTLKWRRRLPYCCGEPAISHDSHHVSLVQWTTCLLPSTRDTGSNPLGGLMWNWDSPVSDVSLHCKDSLGINKRNAEGLVLTANCSGSIIMHQWIRVYSRLVTGKVITYPHLVSGSNLPATASHKDNRNKRESEWLINIHRLTPMVSNTELTCVRCNCHLMRYHRYLLMVSSDKLSSRLVISWYNILLKAIVSWKLFA